MENSLDSLCKYLNFVCKSQEINEIVLDACKNDIENAKRPLQTIAVNKENMEAMIAEKRKYLKKLLIRLRLKEVQEINFFICFIEG